MNEKYLISITGIQEINGEKNKIEVLTTGDYTEKNGHKYIKYKEYSNDDPNISSDTVVKVEGDDKVTVIRMGENSSRLILEKGRRHQCHYSTQAGDIMIGIFTNLIDQSLSEQGGEISVSYQLDFFSDVVSTNEFHIKIKEKEV